MGYRMILVVDEYKKEYRMLKESMKSIGSECDVVSFSPLGSKVEEESSIYEYYVTKTETQKLEDKSLYYAFMDMPDLWEVRADGVNGAIYDRNHKKAEIYFTEPIERRNVLRVEWMDDDGEIYRIDHYNRYGDKFCIEYIQDGTALSREFYNHAQQLVILEQVKDEVVTIFQKGKIINRFIGYSEFLQAYLIEKGMHDSAIVFADKKIQGRFKNLSMHSHKVLDVESDKIYWNTHKPEDKFGNTNAFILTGTDQVESIEKLIQDLPEIQFHIAAHTLMSDKLMNLSSCENVTLYPAITEPRRDELLETCGLYLDINYWDEIYNVVPEAVVHNLMILAFDSTIHHSEFTLEEHIYSVSRIEQMEETVRLLLQDPIQYGDRLYRQRLLFEQIRIQKLKRLES